MSVQRFAGNETQSQFLFSRSGDKHFQRGIPCVTFIKRFGIAALAAVSLAGATLGNVDRRGSALARPARRIRRTRLGRSRPSSAAWRWARWRRRGPTVLRLPGLRLRRLHPQPRGRLHAVRPADRASGQRLLLRPFGARSEEAGHLIYAADLWTLRRSRAAVVRDIERGGLFRGLARQSLSWYIVGD